MPLKGHARRPTVVGGRGFTLDVRLHVETHGSGPTLSHLGLTLPQTDDGQWEDMQLDPTLSSKQRNKLKRFAAAIIKSGDHDLLDSGVQQLFIHFLSIVDSG